MDKLNDYREQLREKDPEQTIRWALNEFGADRIVLASSFSIEDQVLTRIMAGVDDSARIFTLDTGRLFQETYGRRLLSNKTIVVIFSDGWDRGQINLLKTQMAYIKRKAYKVIWLNPLRGTKDYQPICQGMSAALPYVDYFLPMGDPHDLILLEGTLEKMIA